MPGGIMLAGTRERFDWLKMAKARAYSHELELISPTRRHGYSRSSQEAFRRRAAGPIEARGPLRRDARYAKAAQIGGAQVVRHTRVTTSKRAATALGLITEAGNVHAGTCQCGGLWAREVGAWWAELPILAMQPIPITGGSPRPQGAKGA